MKIAIFGGSFDPVTNGHVAAVKSVLQNLDYDKVIIVPAYCSPWKQKTHDSYALEVFRDIFKNDKRIIIDSIELDQKKPVFAVDTIMHFIAKYKIIKNDDIGLILGSDLEAAFHKWEYNNIILKLAHLIFINRNGYDYQNKYSAILVTPPYDESSNASSTEVRSNIENNLPWEHLVPPQMTEIIKREKLYEKG